MVINKGKTVFIVAVVSIAGLIVFPYLVIKCRYRPDILDSFNWLIKNQGKNLPFSKAEKYGAGRGFIYCQHPFTNWSLNPAYTNCLGESNHTIEGFRKTQAEDSIARIAGANPGAFKIVCVGSSTTYCNFVPRYQDTWPVRLKEKLGRKDVLVFNFGVGAWTTFQSLIRCVSWLPVVRPQMLIFYQAKNDLSVLVNGAEKEKEIFVDYQNVMAQYSECISLKFSRWLMKVPLFALIEMRRLLNKDLFLNIYNRPRPWANSEGLKRLNNELLEGILFRIEALVNICSMLDCRMVYIPELTSREAYTDNLNQIYARVPGIISKYNNAFFIDLRENMLNEAEKYFPDGIHFNEQGCEVFAQALAERLREVM